MKLGDFIHGLCRSFKIKSLCSRCVGALKQFFTIHRAATFCARLMSCVDAFLLLSTCFRFSFVFVTTRFYIRTTNLQWIQVSGLSLWKSRSPALQISYGQRLRGLFQNKIKIEPLRPVTFLFISFSFAFQCNGPKCESTRPIVDAKTASSLHFHCMRASQSIIHLIRFHALVDLV